MSIVFRTKIFSGLVDNSAGTSIFYSPPEFNAALAGAEKSLFEARPTQVSGTSPELVLFVEVSNDGVNWIEKNTPIQADISNSPQAVFGQDLGVADAGGCYSRVGIFLTGTAPVAFVEVWVTGRDAT